MPRLCGSSAAAATMPLLLLASAVTKSSRGLDLAATGGAELAAGRERRPRGWSRVHGPRGGGFRDASRAWRPCDSWPRRGPRQSMGCSSMSATDPHVLVVVPVSCSSRSIPRPPLVRRNASRERGQESGEVRRGGPNRRRGPHQRAAGRRPLARARVPPCRRGGAHVRARPTLAPPLEVHGPPAHHLLRGQVEERP
uniref:Uncharacterized protein n=1 Tax=Arundo donax TaxID=35708 RepID=A0A0A9EXL1_ARUDO